MIARSPRHEDDDRHELQGRRRRRTPRGRRGGLPLRERLCRVTGPELSDARATGRGSCYFGYTSGEEDPTPCTCPATAPPAARVEVSVGDLVLENDVA
ncbi:MAG: hypothetical protein AVDCRST_MAG12-2224 [uncultured Rubrobacteraceae bacterium]|uniref:Uncharacterized protein n=1 Tax=uncultured Rubrobacteraceae bacterium TaxID=349277 RepID=A0A6J4SGJ0_9ACTN|nr:MAG: hypothetical protein AVDCRST_MAG12-2224 [uncultured Rubrobacteraceae bacterium]